MKPTTTRKTHQDGLTVRKFPFALRMQARAAAANDGMDLDEWIRRLVEQAVERGEGK